MNQLFTNVLPSPAMIAAPADDDQTFGGAPAMRELVEVLLRRKSWIIVTTALFLAAALFHAFNRDREYVATARMLIDPQGIQVVDRDVTPRSQTADGNVAQVESQLRVMTSQSVLERVIESENLLADPEFTGTSRGPFAAVKSLIGAVLGGAAEASDPKLVVLNALSESIVAERPEQSYIVELSVRTGDPEKSARIANAITAAYLDSEIIVQAGLIRRASDSLGGRLGALRENLRTAEDRVERYKAENGIVGADGRLVNEQQLEQWSSQLIEARARTSVARSKLEQVRRLQQTGVAPETLPEVVLSDTIRQLRVQYAAAKQREVALSARLLPGHPVMQQTVAQVQAARGEINAEIVRIAEAANIDFIRESANQRELESQLDGLKQTSFATNGALVRLREFERDAEASRLVYQAFLVRTRELDEQERVDTTDVRVVSSAVPPIAPAGPGEALILAFALICGAGLGGLLALGRETMDPTIRTARQLSQASRLSVLATLPICSQDGDGMLPTFAARYPGSPASLALNSVVDALRRMPRLAEPRTTVVTAAGRNDGKTTVAINLALAAAARGERVLLIDGDLAHQTLSAVRLDEPENGVANVLRGELPVGDVIIPDTSGLIRVLPGGRRSGRLRADQLSTQNLYDAVFCRLQDFDFVVIDAGAATHEGCLGAFAEIADTVVLVVRAGVTNERQVERSVRALTGHWSKLAGAILVADAD